MSLIALVFSNASYNAGIHNGKVQLCHSMGLEYVLPPHQSESCWSAEQIEQFKDLNDNKDTIPDFGVMIQ